MVRSGPAGALSLVASPSSVSLDSEIRHEPYKESRSFESGFVVAPYWGARVSGG